MGYETKIGWTDHTFSPWWGCTNVSPGCDNCYAEAFAKRTGHDVWGKQAGRRFFGDKHWDEPLMWSGRVFCASMCDVFEADSRLDEHRLRLWDLIGGTPQLTWQLLTKRPENVQRMVPAGWLAGWPANVWLGTTVEDEQRAMLRIPRLLAVPASVLFLSCEPMLEQLTLQPWMDVPGWPILRSVGSGRIGWVICGGESGPHRRPFDLAWAYDLADQCDQASVPFFFKQAGGLRPGTPGPDDLDRRKEFPDGVTAR